MWRLEKKKAGKKEEEGEKEDREGRGGSRWWEEEGERKGALGVCVFGSGGGVEWVGGMGSRLNFAV